MLSYISLMFYFMSKVPRYIAFKYMCEILYKRSKESNVEGVEDTLYRFQCIKLYLCRRCRRWCLWLLRNTVCRVQISCRRCRRYSVLCIHWPLTPPGGKARCSRTVHPVGLAVHHHAVQGGSFVLKNSGTCQTTRVIAGKTHSQSPILKCYGVLSNPVILSNV